MRNSCSSEYLVATISSPSEKEKDELAPKNRQMPSRSCFALASARRSRRRRTLLRRTRNQQLQVGPWFWELRQDWRKRKGRTAGPVAPGGLLHDPRNCWPPNCWPRWNEHEQRSQCSTQNWEFNTYEWKLKLKLERLQLSLVPIENEWST